MACYLLSDCSGLSDSFYTVTDLGIYVDQVIKIEGCDTCWTVSATAEECPEAREVVFATSYTTCEDCIPVYDCATCPPGYSLNQNNECELVTTSPAVYTGTTTTVTAGDVSNGYGNLSLCLLEDISTYTFPVLGTGATNAGYNFIDNNGSGVVVSRVPGYSPVTFGLGTGTILNQLWWSSPASGTSDGRLNIAGVWAPGINDCTPSTNTPPGCENEPGYYLEYTYCVNTTETRQYTIGVAADNEVHVTINGTLVFKLSAQNSNVKIPFANWTVFPFTLPAGQNIIQLKGFNFDNIASFAAEIYNLSKAEFIANVCTPGTYSGGWVDPGSTPADLEPYILFTTRDTIGQEVPSGEGVYECPDGSTVDFCTGDPVCSCTTYLPYRSCCYILTDCSDNENIINTSAILEEYLNKVVKIEGYDECWFVSVDTAPCAVPNPVVVTEVFDECTICLPSYILYNCNDVNTVIYTETNLQSSLGDTIKINEYPTECWQVGPNPERLQPLQVVTPSGESFASCLECNPIKYQLVNCLNNESFIVSNSELANYLGKVVRVEGIPGICFTVQTDLCDCVIVETRLQNYTANKISELNGRNVYTFIESVSGDQITLLWSSDDSQWQFLDETGAVLSYSTIDTPCPIISYWITEETSPIQNMIVRGCYDVIYDITVENSFPNCDYCVNC